MKIHSVFDPEFARYGRVMSGYDLEPLLATLEAVSPMPETGTAYVAEQPELMALPVAKALSDRAFGGLPVELGWCNGRNTKLNCLDGSLTVVNRRRGRKGLCGLIFFVKFENNACSMG